MRVYKKLSKNKICLIHNYYLLDGLADSSQLKLLLLNFHLGLRLFLSGKHYWTSRHVLDTNQYQLLLELNLFIVRETFLLDLSLYHGTHLRSKGGQTGKVLWKAGVEGKLLSVDDENENPKDVDNDETEVNNKDCCIKLFDKSYDHKDRIDVECNQTHEKKKKTPDFESLTVDDCKEDGKDVDGYKNVDKKLPKWIRAVSPS